MNAGRSSLMAVDGKNLVMCSRNSLQCNTVLGAWKRHWLVLHKWCAKNKIDTHFIDTPSI